MESIFFILYSVVYNIKILHIFLYFRIFKYNHPIRDENFRKKVLLFD